MRSVSQAISALLLLAILVQLQTDDVWHSFPCTDATPELAGILCMWYQTMKVLQLKH